MGLEVRDLWPASVVSVGALEEGLILRYLRWVELRLYKSAKKIVVVTDSFARIIKERSIDESKICVIKNGANLSLYKGQRKDLLLEESLGLKDKFVLGYIGTHGMAHRLEFILECSEALSHTNCHFLFVGSGAEKDELVSFAKRLELKNVTFLDPVKKEEVWKYISISDVMVVPLKRSDIFKTVIPSKIFETSAMQTPILLGVDGEARDIVESYNAGLFFEPENLESFTNAADKIKTDEVLYKSLQKGCKNLSLDFSREKLALAMLKELEEVLE